MRLLEVVRPSRFPTAALRWCIPGRPMQEREKIFHTFPCIIKENCEGKSVGHSSMDPTAIRSHEILFRRNRFLSRNRPTDGVRFVAEFATSLLNNDLKKLRKTMEVFFAGIPYNVHKKQEANFQAIFFSIFRLLGVYVEAESSTNDGRIGAVIRTPQAIYIFEFKLDKDPTALAQIREKEYFKKYLLDKRDIYIVGVNFDSVKGNLTGWEDEKIEK